MEAACVTIACAPIDKVRAMQNCSLASSLCEVMSVSGASDAVNVLIVGDDDFFRESLARNLVEEGYEVTSLSSGAALEHFASGDATGSGSLAWQTSGLEILRCLRRTGNRAPVMLLTVPSEEPALEEFGVDFTEKLRSLPVLVKCCRAITERARSAPDADRRRTDNLQQIGALELRLDINRASWAGAPIDLTLTEFKIIALLALRVGEDVSYREIYDLVHGKDFSAGYGDEGYRPNVRTFIKRIRKKLRAVDPEFEHIQNYAGFGYRYHRNSG
jgi:two-component system, OmpR family, response regulator ChvI